MAAITTVLNPVAKNKVFLFYSNEHKSLSLEYRVAGEGKGQPIGPDAATSPVPELLLPSSLVSFVYECCVYVYGVTTSTVEGKQVRKLCLLSPVYQPRASPTNGFMAGCVDAKTSKAWLFFHGTTSGNPRIVQKEISNNAVSDTPLTGLKNYLTDTKLAAVYDPMLLQKWLFYQTDDKNICTWNVGAGKADTLSESKDHAREGTNIGACYVPADPTSGRTARIYVYTCHPDNNLRRAWSEAGKSLSFPTSFSKVGEAEISPTSQISVVADPEHQRNLIHLVQAGSSEISVLEDSYGDSK